MANLEPVFRLSAVLKKNEIMSDFVSSNTFRIERILDDLEKKFPEENELRDIREIVVSLRVYASEYL